MTLHNNWNNILVLDATRHYYGISPKQYNPEEMGRFTKVVDAGY